MEDKRKKRRKAREANKLLLKAERARRREQQESPFQNILAYSAMGLVVFGLVFGLLGFVLGPGLLVLGAALIVWVAVRADVGDL